MGRTNIRPELRRSIEVFVVYSVIGAGADPLHPTAVDRAGRSGLQISLPESTLLLTQTISENQDCKYRSERILR